MRSKPTFLESALFVALVLLVAAIGWPLFSHYKRLSRRSEVPENLKKIFEGATLFNDRALLQIRSGRPSPHFPSSSRITPSIHCCDKGRSQPCVPGGHTATSYSLREWESVTWKALRFQLRDPHLFRYRFLKGADGISFTAEALGDLNCDGKSSRFWRRGKLQGDRVVPELTLHATPE